MSLSSPFLDRLIDVAEVLPPSTIDTLCARWETLAGPPTDAIGQDVSAISGERARIEALVRAWRAESPTVSGAQVAASLRASARTYRREQVREQVELVWTGPIAETLWRRTDQALLQVIDAAREELWLVTFAAYSVPRLQDALARALDRGVIVRFIGESVAHSDGKVSVDPARAFAALGSRVRYFVWPREARETDERGNFGALHAKCALADMSTLFVSSANFTGNALNLNMEMGLLISGGELPAQVNRHFQGLLRRQILRENPPSSPGADAR